MSITFRLFIASVSLFHLVSCRISGISSILKEPTGAPDRSVVRVGINPVTWSNDDLPTLGADISLERSLREAALAGYDGMELGHKFPRSYDKLAPIMIDHKLMLATGWHSGNLLSHGLDAEIRRITPHLELLKSMGSSVLIYAETTGAVHTDLTASINSRKVLSKSQWKAFGRDLTALGDYIQSHGLRMVYHHHMGTVVQTPDEVEKLMANTGESVWLNLDTGHMTYAGGDPVEISEKYGHRIGHVHLKDIRADILEDSVKKDKPFLSAVLDGMFTVPGDGSVNFDGVLANLRKSTYRGWLIVEAEQDPAKAHPLKYAKMGLGNIQPILEEHGFQRLSKDPCEKFF